MKKVFIINVLIFLFVVVIKVNAFAGQYEEISKSNKVDVIIYAKKTNDIYRRLTGSKTPPSRD